MAPSVREIESLEELPKPVTAMLSRGEAARALSTTETNIAAWIHDGALPAYRVAGRRYYIDPADLALVQDRLPEVPESIRAYLTQAEAAAARAERETQRFKVQVDREMAELRDLIANERRKSRWKLLDELSLEELLDYLREFRTDRDDLGYTQIETEQGLQREIDRDNLPQSLGQRPRGVPKEARFRRLSTGIGQIDIWYWRRTSGRWSAAYGGPRPQGSPGRSYGFETAFAAIKQAGLMARSEYGKPIRQSSARLRFAVLERDGFACHYCGRKPPTVELLVDHVVPVADGGSNDIDNLVAACQECNSGKSDRGLAG